MKLIYVALLTVVGVLFVHSGVASDIVSVRQLAGHTHIHGLAVDRQDSSRLLIATHHGLFSAGADGQAMRISEVQDFMGFSPHPSEPGKFYASGHPPQGGNLGFMMSGDGGRTWRRLANGVGGPVDFHQMTVSPADPRTIYGFYNGLQISRDGGNQWSLVGKRPEKLIDLAASARDPNRVFAATEDGLLMSVDAGKAWQPVLVGKPVSLLHVTPEGQIYIFAIGRGLLRSAEQPLNFVNAGFDFGSHLPRHMAVDATNQDRMFIATARGSIFISLDAGRSWKLLGD